MRAIIYGAGAVGGVIGGHLALAGQEAIFIERTAAHAEAIKKRGLRLVTLSGTHVLRLPVVDSPDQALSRPEQSWVMVVTTVRSFIGFGRERWLGPPDPVVLSG